MVHCFSSAQYQGLVHLLYQHINILVFAIDRIRIRIPLSTTIRTRRIVAPGVVWICPVSFASYAPLATSIIYYDVVTIVDIC